jgi:phage shock protein C
MVRRRNAATTRAKGVKRRMIESTKRLHRSKQNAMFAGVAVGLAEYFNVDPTLVRLLFVALALTGGHGLLLYLILWAILPVEDRTV